MTTGSRAKHLLDELSRSLKLGSTYPEDHALQRLIHFTQSSDFEDIFDNGFPVFFLNARQVLDGHCRRICEQIIFRKFRQVPRDERPVFFHKLNAELVRLTDANSDRLRLLTDAPPGLGSLTVQESQQIEIDKRFSNLRAYHLRATGYEDVDLSEIDVVQILKEIETLLESFPSPSLGLVDLFNQFVVHASLDLGYNRLAD